MELNVLNQRYQLLEQLGAGGMATVYRAYDQLLDRPVAVKVLRPLYANDQSFRERFLSEARAAARLDHPNIVRIYDVGESEDQQPYIIMELVEGQDLKTLIQAQRPLPMPQALNLARQICSGVGYAHRTGIVHCDLKPENILVTPTGQAKVADFGIARVLQDGLRTTEKEVVVWGSPHYLSPEQAAGETPVPASDVYSIGVIMYEMLTGVPPFHSEDPTELLTKHLRETPAPLTSLNPRIPPQIEWMILKVLAKESAHRYRNAEQFGLALTAYVQQGSEMTAPQNTLTPPPPPHIDATVAITPPPYSAPSVTPMKGAALSQEPENNSPDWFLGVLLVVAFVAVVGLIPLYMSAWRLYQTAPPMPGPTLEVTETVLPTEPGAIVTVPSLLGLTAPDAQRLIEGLGLRLTVLGEQESADATPGAIIVQQPNAGTRVSDNTEVQVVIAAGRSYVLPELIGYSLDGVRTGLETEGLLIVTEEIWSTEPAGRILGQLPPAGLEVRAGATVTLTISGGVEQPLPLQVNLNNQVMLEEAFIQRASFRAGSPLPLTLRWRCLQPLAPSYKVFVHLLSLNGQQLIAQRDVEPVSGLRPTNTWQPGELIIDPHQITIPNGTPAGTYQLRVGLYIPEGRLPVVDSGKTQVIEHSIFITNIEITP